jgi:guanylate kinase
VSKIFVISGPSGSGKTTLSENLLRDKALKGKIVKSVSLTTRPKRTAEINTKHYFYITEGEFKKRLRSEKILEWTKYLGYYYATPKDFIDGQLKRNRNILMCLDLKGALRIKKLYPNKTVTIFIMPPSLGTLQERIRMRCSRTRDEEVRKRLKLAGKELSASASFDYRIVNKNLAQAVKELKGIILNKTSNS